MLYSLSFEILVSKFHFFLLYLVKMNVMSDFRVYTYILKFLNVDEKIHLKYQTFHSFREIV